MAAPSGYLGYLTAHKSNEIAQEVCVPFTTRCTFYSVLNWNGGNNDSMAGYAGLQVLADNSKTFHFSIWDPDSGTEKPYPVQLHPKAANKRFENEGEGMKIIMPFDFMENEWYRIRVNIAHQNKYTQVNCYLAQNENEELICSAHFPHGNCYFLSGYSSFIEDFCNTPNLVRQYYIRKGNSFDVDNQSWRQWNEQRFNFNTSDPNKSINAGVENNSFFLQSGGDTKLLIQNDTILSVGE